MAEERIGERKAHVSSRLDQPLEQQSVSSPALPVVSESLILVDSLAGSDTTGISLRAIIYYVVQNPNVYRKLQQEIDEADRAGKLSEQITYAECLELEYL